VEAAPDPMQARVDMTPRLVPVALVALLALSACANDKPAESPEATASSAEPDAVHAPPADHPTPDADPPAVSALATAPKPSGVPAGLAMDTYELTPSDCDALGRHYGEVAKADQVAQLSPRLNEAKRAATVEQIDKVVGKLSDTWTNTCQTTLVNRAVDHDHITCALKSKSVHEFDVCLNGNDGTPQQPAKGKKR